MRGRHERVWLSLAGTLEAAVNPRSHVAAPQVHPFPNLKLPWLKGRHTRANESLTEPLRLLDMNGFVPLTSGRGLILRRLCQISRMGRGGS